MEIRKDMPGLKQAGCITNDQLTIFIYQAGWDNQGKIPGDSLILSAFYKEYHKKTKSNHG
jgi:hypothetical protein